MKSLVGKIANAAGYEIRRLNRGEVRNRSEERIHARIHYLHIGKNAGTQVTNIARQINKASSSRRIKWHDHDVFLRSIPAEDGYFFSIRNPISRFRSGFYSRKRKGLPRKYFEWSPHDELAFKDFEHANDLAENLFQRGERGKKAWAAMKSIRHAAQNQSDWFYCCGNFLSVQPPIWIIRQDAFDHDMRKFIDIAFPEIDKSSLNFDFDDVASHKNDYSGIPQLSQKAEGNLRSWYAQDFVFYEMCKAWLKERE